MRVRISSLLTWTKRLGGLVRVKFRPRRGMPPCVTLQCVTMTKKLCTCTLLVIRWANTKWWIAHFIPGRPGSEFEADWGIWPEAVVKVFHEFERIFSNLTSSHVAWQLSSLQAETTRQLSILPSILHDIFTTWKKLRLLLMSRKSRTRRSECMSEVYVEPR